MGQPTYGGNAYGPGYNGRLLTPEEIRNAPLRRRGLLRRRYAAKEVDEFLAFVAADIESRINHEEGLLHTIGQLRMQNDSINRELRRWQSQQFQAQWTAEHT